MKYKVPKNTKKAAALLLKIIVDKLGGYTAIGRKTGHSKQSIRAAVEQGYISLNMVYGVSEKYKITPWALSYTKLAEALGEKYRSLPEVMVDIMYDGVITEEERTKILKLLKK